MTCSVMKCQLLMLGLLVGLGSAAKILVTLPMPWKSHHFVYHGVIRELAARGHHIDYLASVQMKNPHPNITHLPLSDDLDKQMYRVQPVDLDQPWEPLTHYKFQDNVFDAIEKTYSQEPEVKKLLKSTTNYDIVLSEFQLYQYISLAWVHKFNALPVSLMVLGDVSHSNELNGLPDNPAYMVDFTGEYSEQMSLYERAFNTAEHIASLLVNNYFIWKHQTLADKIMHYPGWESRPPLAKMASDMALVLVNAHPAVSYTTPKAPHVKEIGGMTLTGSVELPKDLKKFMDEATDGVVYFNLGTNINMNQLTNKEKIDELVKMFRKQKQKFLIKWTGENMPNIADDKIRFLSWAPQLGILAHENTKLFITHGGLQGVMETVHYGVPIVGIPIFADQPKNIKFLILKGCGVALDKRNLTGQSLEWAMKEVILNPTYKEAIMKRSRMLRDSLVRPVDEAVYWIEYVLKHGKVLQPASLHLPFYKLYLLDVLAIFTVMLLIFIAVTIKTINVLRQLLCPMPTSKRIKKD